jgi:hypothetical protein
MDSFSFAKNWPHDGIVAAADVKSKKIFGRMGFALPAAEPVAHNDRIMSDTGEF